MSAVEHKPGGARRTPARNSAAGVIAVAASAGGLEPIKWLVAAVSRHAAVAMVIAQHVSTRSYLPEILRCHCDCHVDFALAGTHLRAGAVYVCPPQRHVIVNPDATLSVSDTEPLNFVRPSADWLFDSVAASYGNRSIGVVLSGRGNDGSRGVRSIAAAAGIVIVQKPATCQFPQMPNASIATGRVHYITAPESFSPLLQNILGNANFEAGHALWRAGFAHLSSDLNDIHPSQN